MSSSTRGALARGTARRHGMREAEFIAMLATASATIALSIDTLLPAFGEIRSHFGLASDDNVVSWTVTIFFLGIALGQLWWGPFSDRFGRKPALRASLSMLALGAGIAMLAPSLFWLLAGRLIAGLGAAGSRAITLAMTRDCYEGDTMARISSLIMAVFLVAPVVGPSLGEGLLLIGDWRWTIGISVVAAGLLSVWLLRCDETLDPADQRPLRLGPMSVAAREVAGNRFVVACIIAQVALYGAFLPWLGSSEIIIAEIYDRPGQFALLFGGSAAVMGVSIAVAGASVTRIGTLRLIISLSAITTVLAVATTVVAWQADGRPGFWVFFVPATALVTLNSVVSPLLQSQAMLPVGHIAGTAAAVIGAVVMASGALLGRIVDSQVTDSVTPFLVGFAIFSAIGWVAALDARRHRPLNASPDHNPSATNPPGLNHRPEAVG